MIRREVAAVLKAHPLLSGLPDSVTDELAGCARNVAFGTEALLLVEGEPAETFYLLRRGRVAIEVRSPVRGPLVIETRNPGDVVGWSWMVPPYRSQFDARALEPVGAVAVDAACLRRKAETDPAIGYLLLQRVAGVLVDRLQATRLRLLDLYEVPGAR